ncbi:hypothetical protein ASE19_04305 [Nocardioides sp. Root79]|nr:hypothetical protein ASE19_04305 [Nocardioides sp. Root79]KRC73944.1 hypothetical protein ASE20_04910 [Nocardioides sp. Root240]
MGLPAPAVGDLAELLDVHVDQFGGPVALVADRGLLRGADHFSCDRVQLSQVSHAVAAQDPRHRPHSDLRAEYIGTITVFGAGRQHLQFDLIAGLGRHAVRS